MFCFVVCETSAPDTTVPWSSRAEPAESRKIKAAPGQKQFNANPLFFRLIPIPEKRLTSLAADSLVRDDGSGVTVPLCYSPMLCNKKI